MKPSPNILLIAPYAPPKNAAEAIQVRRILAELDLVACGTLVTIRPDSAGWARRDASLELELAHFDTQNLVLPLHRLTNRLFMSHPMTRFHVPDAMAWIRWMAGRVVRNLHTKPDVIYSRSQPMSAAILARNLKRRLNIPWIMHLSDPWAEILNGSVASPRNSAYEADCFALADRIALTTEGQAAHYRNKYPALASKIIVSPNVMPDAQEVKRWLANAPAAVPDDRLRIVFAGNLYGERSPAPLMAAIEWLRVTQPELLTHLRIDIYGHVQQHCMDMLAQAPDVVQHHGSVSFERAIVEQHAADIILTIDADGIAPLYKHFLSCKVTDSFALGKPLLAITPDGSEAERICHERYGWAASSSRPKDVASCISDLIIRRMALRRSARKTPPDAYTAAAVARDILQHMKQIITASAP